MQGYTRETPVLKSSFVSSTLGALSQLSFLTAVVELFTRNQTSRMVATGVVYSHIQYREAMKAYKLVGKFEQVSSFPILLQNLGIR